MTSLGDYVRAYVRCACSSTASADSAKNGVGAILAVCPPPLAASIW